MYRDPQGQPPGRLPVGEWASLLGGHQLIWGMDEMMKRLVPKMTFINALLCIEF